MGVFIPPDAPCRPFFPSTSAGSKPRCESPPYFPEYYPFLQPFLTLYHLFSNKKNNILHYDRSQTEYCTSHCIFLTSQLPFLKPQRKLWRPIFPF